MRQKAQSATSLRLGPPAHAFLQDVAVLRERHRVGARNSQPSPDRISLRALSQLGCRICIQNKMEVRERVTRTKGTKKLYAINEMLLALYYVDQTPKIQPRLATVRKAFIVPADELGTDDRLVATCLSDRLHMITPVEVAKTKAEADAIFVVKGHIPGAARRYALGMSGATPSANLEVQLPDGTKLWTDGAKNRKGTAGIIGAARAEDSIACGLASRLANTLLEAMRDARGK
jgi:hypothetical protein